MGNDSTAQRGEGCTSVDIAKSTHKFCVTVQALTIYDLLLKHMYKQLPKDHVFQHITLVVVMVLFFGMYMAFKHPWIVYSEQLDGGAFCVGCAIKDCDTGHMLVSEPDPHSQSEGLVPKLAICMVWTGVFEW